MNPKSYKLLRCKSLLFITSLMGTTIINFTCAQEKLEREYRLKLKEVPVKLISFVDSIAPGNKIKWYREVGLTEQTTEAKTRHNGKKYSIEFDKTGLLQDIEIETNWEAIPKILKNQINNYLGSKYDYVKVCRIQEQYSGKKMDLYNYLIKGLKTPSVTIKYELVVKGKDKSGKHLYEFLFSEKGYFEKKSKIIFRSTDNMEF